MMSNEKFKYQVISSTDCSIVEMLDEDATVIEIPNFSPEGLKVTRIGNSAFKRNQMIEEIVFPSTLEYIGDKSFKDCFNLKKVTFTGPISMIGTKAFENCGLKIVIMQKADYISEYAFASNKNLNMYFLDKVETICSHAFENCNKILFVDNFNTQFDWAEDIKYSSGLIKSLTREEMMKELGENFTDSNDENGMSLNSEDANSNESMEETYTDVYVDNYNEEYEEESYEHDEEIDNDQLNELDDEASSKTIIALNNPRFTDIGLRKTIHYSKTKTICFTATALMLTNIPVKQSMQLAFFEKYTILLLKKGIQAEDIYELAGKISSILNISVKCIREFLNYLSQNEYLICDNNVFGLNSNFIFEIDKEYDNAMFAEIDTKMAECSNVLLCGDDFYLIEDFSNSFFRIKHTHEKMFGELVKANIHGLLKANKDTIEKLLIRHFDKTNTHLKKDSAFTFSFNRDRAMDYEYEFEVMIEYEYFIDEKNAYMSKVIVPENSLPIEFFENLTKIYELDTDIPEFITLDEKIYQPAIKHLELYEKTSNEIDKIENSILENLDSYNTEVDSLGTQIEKLEYEKQQLEDQLKKLEDEKNESAKNVQMIISNNNGNLNVTTKNVLAKYPFSKDVLGRYVTDICLELDKALSASQYESYDEVWMCLDHIREGYRKVLQAVFEVLLNKQIGTLGVYLSNPFNKKDLKDTITKRNSQIQLDNLIKFHTLANAVGHSAENGEQKEKNEKRIKDFQKLNAKEREMMLLSIPKLFESLTFTSDELRRIISKLKIA